MIQARIAHVSTIHQPRDNRIFNKECCSLAKAGADQWLICTQEGDIEERGVKTVGIGKRSRGFFHRLVVSQIKTWKALNRINPDLVHAHDPELIPTVWLWKTLHRKKAIFDSHEDLVGQMDDKPYIPKLVRPLALWYAKLLVKWADNGFDGIVAATPHIKSLFKNKNRVIVHNYPYLNDFPVVDSEVVPGRVVYVGMLSLGRQVDLMLDTVAAVPEATMVIAGGTDEDTASLIEKATEGDQVSYLGKIPLAEVSGLLASGYVGFVFLQPLKNNIDALPTKLFEYLASGVPAIVTGFPALKEKLSPYDCCVFVDTSTVDEPIKALRELIEDPTRRNLMGENGRKAFEEVFNFDKEVPSLIAVSKTALQLAE